MLPDKIVYLTKKIMQHMATGNDNYFQKNTYNLDCTMNFKCKSCTLLCLKKTQFHQNINISSLFWLKFIKCPYLYSSKLDHTVCPDLFLVIEAWRYERTSFTLLKDCSQPAIHTAIISSFCKAIRRMSGGLQDAIILNCTA